MSEQTSVPESILSAAEVEDLVVEHKGWSESIARSVARAWSVDWQLDGLDGAALEALLFCARRYDPAREIPFKGYARKRIHEAATEAARCSRGWKRGAGSVKRTERLAREVSVELFNAFPELHAGLLPAMGEDLNQSKGARIAIQQLLIGATVIAAKQSMADAEPDSLLDLKQTVRYLVELDPVHQTIMWKVYWEGHSLRGVASGWSTDELNVIREHKVLLEYLQKRLSKVSNVKIPRVRPGLRHVPDLLDEQEKAGIFATITE